MKQVQTIEDVFPVLDEVIWKLKSESHLQLADTLEHRIRRVAWTTRSELVEELHSVISKAISTQPNLSQQLQRQMQAVVQVMDNYLKCPEN